MGTGVGQESKEFLQVLLKLKDESDAKMPLTMIEIKALLMKRYGGWAKIMNKPYVLRKLQQELEVVVGKDNIVKESHIQQLPYRSLCSCERSLAFTSNSSTLDTVPNGSRVFVNVWAIQRDPSIWKNPREFCPERFFDNKWDDNGNDVNYFPFGSGRRICAGIVMAERIFMYSLASLIHSFDWKLPEGETLDLTEKFGIVLKKKVPLVAIPTPKIFQSEHCMSKINMCL
uniref:Cytochrome P450 n=1 Tax=Solanum lycopersicum TaxID=4081 RepID=A0A3Q7HV77_SOLLC